MIANFKSPKEIKRYDRTQSIILKTGNASIDKTILGLDLGQVSIVSGINGSGKSSWLNQVALDVIMQGYGVGIFSGELTDWRLMNWLYLQTAGRDYVSTGKDNDGNEYYYVKDSVKDKIDNWLDENLFIYDNNGGVDIDTVGKNVQSLLLNKKNVKLIIIDNLMSMDISRNGSDKYDAQKQVILKLTTLAKMLNVHIIFVCHPVKCKDFIRKEDISGSSDLANAVDNIFLVHRVTQDFKKRSMEFFGWGESHPIYTYDNVIEIAKNRELGSIEKLCGMYFELKTKRFLNSKEEYKHYGWEDNNDEQQLMPLDNVDVSDIF